MKLSKGIAYFAKYSDAAQIARDISGIVRYYTLGWAVQYYISGPYYPE